MMRWMICIGIAWMAAFGLVTEARSQSVFGNKSVFAAPYLGGAGQMVNGGMMMGIPPQFMAPPPYAPPAQTAPANAPPSGPVPAGCNDSRISGPRPAACPPRQDQWWTGSDAGREDQAGE